MASLTFVVDEQLKRDIKHFSWVNWSEVNREELNKKRIFEEFIRTGTLSDNDQEFCDGIGWYPVDELPLREEYVKKLRGIKRGPHSRMTSKELDKLIGLE
jgi:hypothetical protein